jgi:hypothetical protein
MSGTATASKALLPLAALLLAACGAPLEPGPRRDVAVVCVGDRAVPPAERCHPPVPAAESVR